MVHFSNETDSETARDVLEALEKGVDLLSYSQSIPRGGELPTWRKVNGRDIKLYTCPVRDSRYTEERLGNRDYSKEKNCAKNSTCGYCPRVYCDDISKEKDHFFYPTGGKNLKYMHVIASQLISWLQQDCVRVVGELKETGKEMDAQAILPWIVEPKKPRCCVDGSCFTCTAPLPKPVCVLDNAVKLMSIIEPNDHFHVVDDQSGFLQAMINHRSQTFCRILFGKTLLTHRSLAFGLTKSPSIFQSLNRVAVSALNRRGYPTLLYLDDRLLKEKLYRPLLDHETSIGGYCLLCLLVAFGGFISMLKSNFKPVQRGRFLGFDIDTVEQTIGVPLEKFTKTVSEIELFIKGLTIHGQRFMNMKLLERIRGRIISWMLVCENWGFFTREMNHTLKIHMARFEGPRAETDLMLLDNIDNYDELVEELTIWTEARYVDLVRKWRSDDHLTLDIRLAYTDASGGGLGSAIPIGGGFELRKFALPLWLAPLGIHVKEAYAIVITIESYGDRFYNRRLTILCDNRAVVEAWNGQGARDLPLARVLKRLIKKCRECKIHLTLKWVPTNEQEADAPSRDISHVFSRLKRYFGNRLVTKLGVNLDLFADPGNVLVDGLRYFSEYPFPDRAGLDGMAYLEQSKETDVIYAYPPRVLVSPFLKVN